MTSPVVVVASRMLLPTAFAFSVYLLWRGHNNPGGGFVGGLIAASGCTVYALANGRAALARLLHVSPKTIAGIGLLFALASGVPALLIGEPYLTHRWLTLVGQHIGTALVFDLGVYLTVIGAVLTFLDYYHDV
jgi:multicomponent Na+:H+ antiporter subunit B